MKMMGNDVEFDMPLDCNGRVWNYLL